MIKTTQKNSSLNSLAISLLVALTFFLSYSENSFSETTDGTATALLLNERFNRKDDTCNGNPAYYCSGVIIRANEQPDLFNTWTPYLRVNENFLQFSYIRKDVGVNLWAKGFGIILKARDDEEYSTRCFFPVNALTGARLGHGCGDTMSFKNTTDEDVDDSTCNEKGINSAEEWVAKFKALPTPENVEKACSFSTHDASAFDASLKAMILLGATTNNELIVNTSPSFWSETDPSKDHIQALWYYKSGDGLDGARSEQQKYYDLTGDWVPVISINSANDNVFSYSDSDQKVKPSSLRRALSH